MDGIIVQSANIPGEAHPSLAGKAKGTAVRKALGEITNVKKHVAFGDLKPLSQKSTQVLLPNPTSVNKKKLQTPNMKSTALTPFKIHTDFEVKAKTQKKNKYSEPNEREYMPPCTDKEFELPLPLYLRGCVDFKPIYNIDLTPDWKEVDVDKMIQGLNEEILNAKFDDIHLEDGELDLTKLRQDFDDNSLLNAIDSDESFSLEVLDQELRAAGLDVSSWT